MLNEIPARALRNLFGKNISTTQVLQTVASGMADCGVEVVIHPDIRIPQADPLHKKIYLPAQVKSERALLVVSWFLDHEAAHIIYTPDLRPTIKRWQREGPVFDVCKAEGFKGIPESLLAATKGLLNMVEDSRIEHLLAKRLPGTKKHFLKGPTAAGVDLLVEETFEEAQKLQKEKGLAETPLSPFWVAEMHAYCVLDGWHGQKERDFVRKLLPSHVGWVMDIIDDEFGDIRDITKASYDDLVLRVESAMAKIIEQVLKNAEETDGDGDGEGEGNPSNPYQDKFTKNKKPGKCESKQGEQGEHGGDDEDSSEDESSESGDEGDSSGESSGDGSSSGESGDEDSDEQTGSSGGRGQGDSSEPDDSDDGDDAGSDGDESGDEDEDGTGDSEEQSDGSSAQGGDDSEGDDEDSSGEFESGTGEEVEETESHLDESPVKERQLPKQVEEWAKDADVNMADLIRSGGESTDGDGDHGAMGEKRPTHGASPNVPHETSAEGMPDKYYENMAPGLRSIVIEGVDLNSIVSQQDEVFNTYDDLVRSLMPPNLGPAARKLVGKFKGAPGQAWAGNRVNPRMLQPIIAGRADGRPLFMRRNETVYSKRGVAVMLFLDCSGSMCDDMPGLDIPEPKHKSNTHGYYYRDFVSKFLISHAAIRSLARVFQSSGIPFAVGGFTGTDAKHASWSSNHSRTYDLVNFMFKDFHEPWAHSEHKMIAMNPFTSVNYKGDRICSHTNCDGESLLWAATRLLAREEDIKVLIVASDGLPAGGNGAMQTAFLKYVVKRLELANIYVGALGIGNQGVKHYYRVHELIDSFPPGQGGPETAPLYVQERVIRLVDRLMVEGGNQHG